MYHLPIPRHYLNLGIVQLEMVNILIAIQGFGPFWCSKKILVHCDNMAVVAVLSSSRTRDPFLAACAQNVWQTAAFCDIQLVYKHIAGAENSIEDLLSRLKNSHNDTC